MWMWALEDMFNSFITVSAAWAMLNANKEECARFGKRELKGIIKTGKQKKLKIPDDPSSMPSPQCKAMSILGQLSNQVQVLNAKDEIENKDKFNLQGSGKN